MPKGKKTCPDCGVEAGVRTSVCKCGHRFTSKKSEPSKSNTSISVATTNDCESKNNFFVKKYSFSISNPVIHTPCGPCPYKPNGYKDGWVHNPSQQDIQEWAIKVYSYGNFLPQAVVYWMREFWDINGPNLGREYKEAKEIVLKSLSSNTDLDS